MMIYNVSRGVGKSPEIFGLSEKYLGWVGMGLLLGFLLFALVRGVFGGTFIPAVILFMTAGISFWYAQTMSIKHGDHGASKMSAFRKRPRILIVESRSIFLNLKK